MAPHTSMLNAAGASDSEDDLATANATAQNNSRLNRDHTAAKSKAMGAARRGSTATATKRKAPTKPQNNRQALKDRTNMQHGSDVEEIEEGDGDDDHAAKPKSKRAKTTATQKSRAGNATASRSRTTRRAPAAEALAVIPETQPDPEQEDVSQSIEGVDVEMDVTTVPTPPQVQRFVQRARSTSVQPLQVRPSARSASVQPAYPPPRERSGSASGTERERRGGDPELRRQLNAKAKECENLKLKYQNLEEISEKDAQRKFEQLKSATAEKAKTANEMIAALKKELAELKKSSSSNSNKEDGSGLQKQVSNLTTANESLTNELANVKSSQQVAQNEVKSLEAKLVAARQQLSTVASAQENKNASEAKTSVKGSASLPANATDAQREAKMKENLYSDLTGLIIRSVKRKEGEDEYDCIQTGRNGTMHFHLSIANDASISNPKTPSGLSYEEAEFAYEPLLDETRDRDLLELLPDYLTEEICFPRNQAIKFYGKVCESMTKKIVVEE